MGRVESTQELHTVGSYEYGEELIKYYLSISYEINSNISTT